MPAEIRINGKLARLEITPGGIEETTARWTCADPEIEALLQRAPAMQHVPTGPAIPDHEAALALDVIEDLNAAGYKAVFIRGNPPPPPGEPGMIY